MITNGLAMFNATHEMDKSVAEHLKRKKKFEMDALLKQVLLFLQHF